MFLGYDAPRLHAAINDLPAALLLVAVLFDLGGWLLRRESLRWAGLWTLWAGVLGGWAAVVAGKLAEKALEHGEAIHDLMERHERLAYITMGVFTVVLAWKMYRRFSLAPAEEWATRALSVLGVAGIVWVGVIGGRLMFDHAAGLKSAVMEAEMKDRGAGHEHEPGEADHVDAPGTPPHEHEGAMADTSDTAQKAHVDPPGAKPHKH